MAPEAINTGSTNYGGFISTAERTFGAYLPLPINLYDNLENTFCGRWQDCSLFLWPYWQPKSRKNAILALHDCAHLAPRDNPLYVPHGRPEHLCFCWWNNLAFELPVVCLRLGKRCIAYDFFALVGIQTYSIPQNFINTRKKPNFSQKSLTFSLLNGIIITVIKTHTRQKDGPASTRTLRQKRTDNRSASPHVSRRRNSRGVVRAAALAAWPGLPRLRMHEGG